MPTIRNTLLAALLVVSVLVNGWLAFVLYECSIEVAVLQEEVKAGMADRGFLLNLIPELKPRISKSNLRVLLRRMHPGEPVNELGDHVQWRQFQFWFDKGGELEAVHWSS